MRCESPVKGLLERASGGAEPAWREIVRRYSPLVFSVCRGYRLAGSDADDVAGNVWLRLVVSLGTIREPEALPGWLATTSRRECLAVLREKGRQIPNEDVDRVEPDAFLTSLVEEEERTAVRDALTHLPDRDKELLSLLFSDPPTPYAEISSSLGMPIGAIGPTRQRCLARVRRVPSIAALLLHDGRHCHTN
ncbi:MAG: sigma-70 family RNA polymerase sigma factor [Actinophytocola sp.]|uniref:RNA polymerase sigma factor n=1 Tax=Actinophytocola sp. TaxID=1872138 RepID=UPI00132A9272|nr:sigma-70 family RNA polymerase sigma factor [Actinophytocola sp.]MPZ81590.1 sigma-70 family RNA polymerase sigma factor [Actinophytocola sp.]